MLSHIKLFFTKHFFSPPLPPILLLTGGLISGIWWADVQMPVFGIILFIITGISYGYLARAPYKTALVLCSFCMGVYLVHQRVNEFDNFYQQFDNKLCALRGTVSQISQVSSRKGSWLVQLTTLSVKEQDTHHWVPCTHGIDLYINTQPHYGVADTIEIARVCIKKNKNTSFTKYLMRTGTYLSLFLKNPDIRVLHHPQTSLLRFFSSTSDSLQQQLREKLSYKTHILFNTIFLGKKVQKNRYFDSIKDIFKTWGLSHQLARSGLHLVMFLIILEFFLRCIPIPFTSKQILLLILVCIYHALSVPSISFIRALLTFIFVKISIMLNFTVHYLHLVGLVCFLTLWQNPYHLFFLDFQLSFSLTAALAWLSYVTQFKMAN